MKTTLKIASTASVLAVAVASASAVAAPLNELFFSQNTGWADNANFDFNTSVGNVFDGFTIPTDQTPGTGAPANTFENMAWSGIPPTPTPDNPAPVNPSSSIDILGHTDDNSPVRLKSDFATADIDNMWNAGDIWAITSLVQINNILALNTGGTGNVPNPLWVADTLANFYIYSDDAKTIADELLADTDSLTVVEFWETYNSFSNCPASPTPLGTQCDDIFRVTAADLAPVDFVEGDWKYTIEFGLIPGPSTGDGFPDTTTLVCPNELDPRCVGVVVPDDQIWVFTPEYSPGTSSLFVTASWSAEFIPEPSIIGLFAVGLLGLGYAGRRKQAKS